MAKDKVPPPLPFENLPKADEVPKKRYQVHVHEIVCGDAIITAQTASEAVDLMIGNAYHDVYWETSGSDVEAQHVYEIDEDGDEIEGTRVDLG